MAIDVALVLGLIAQQAYVLATVPFAALDLAEPTTLATIAAALVTVAMLASFASRPLAALRRPLLALFLGGMPIIYVGCALLHGDRSALALESLGVVVFGGLAVIGYLRAPMLIGAGIIAHGVAWDLWHHGHTGYVPDWYAMGCLVADVGVGAFALRFARGTAAQPPAAALAAAMSGA